MAAWVSSSAPLPSPSIGGVGGGGGVFENEFMTELGPRNVLMAYGLYLGCGWRVEALMASGNWKLETDSFHSQSRHLEAATVIASVSVYPSDTRLNEWVSEWVTSACHFRLSGFKKLQDTLRDERAEVSESLNFVSFLAFIFLFLWRLSSSYLLKVDYLLSFIFFSLLFKN